MFRPRGKHVATDAYLPRHAARPQPPVDYRPEVLADRIATLAFLLSWSYAAARTTVLDESTPSVHDLHVLRQWHLHEDVLRLMPERADGTFTVPPVPARPPALRLIFLPVLDALGPVTCLQHEYRFRTLELSPAYWSRFPRGRVLNLEQALFPLPDRINTGFRGRLIRTQDEWRRAHGQPGSGGALTGAKVGELRTAAVTLLTRVRHDVPTWHGSPVVQAALSRATRTDEVLAAMQPVFLPATGPLPAWYATRSLTRQVARSAPVRSVR